MKRSNSNEVREQVRQHILERVYKDDETFEDFKKCAQYVASEFNRVANYPTNIKRIPNEQDRFQDYMQGLPFNFEHMYFNQRQIVNQWLETTDDKYTDEEVAKRYYYMIYKEIKGEL